MDKPDMGWVLSLSRLRELTLREPRRVVRPVSPRIVIRAQLVSSVAPKRKSKKPKRR